VSVTPPASEPTSSAKTPEERALARKLVRQWEEARALRAAMAYLLATGVAWFSPRAGFYLYIVIVLVFAFGQIRSNAMQRLLRHT